MYKVQVIAKKTQQNKNQQKKPNKRQGYVWVWVKVV